MTHAKWVRVERSGDMFSELRLGVMVNDRFLP